MLEKKEFSLFQFLFSFQGRMKRLSYALIILCLFSLEVILKTLTNFYPYFAVLLSLYIIVAWWIGLVIGIRRIRDFSSPLSFKKHISIFIPSLILAFIIAAVVKLANLNYLVIASYPLVVIALFIAVTLSIFLITFYFGFRCFFSKSWEDVGT